MSNTKEVIVAFVPVIHRGYLDFFRKFDVPIYIIGPEFYSDFPKIERDIRTLSAEEVHAMLQVVGLSRDVFLLTRNILSALREYCLVMPDDEITREFTERFLSGISVRFESAFLRWNRTITLKEFEVVPDRVISKEVFDTEMISLALKEAQKSADWYRQIGAVVTLEKKVLFVNHIKYLPTELSQDVYGNPRSNFDAGEKLVNSPIDFTEVYTSIHAEAGIIARAANEGVSLKGTCMYSTTFPCPQCAKLIAEAGVTKVYYNKGYSLIDAERILKAYGVEIVLVDLGE